MATTRFIVGKHISAAVNTPGESPYHMGFEVNIAGHAGGGLASYWVKIITETGRTVNRIPGSPFRD